MPARAPPPPRRYQGGFWGWVEGQLLDLQTSPKKRERAFRLAWYVSMGMVALGVAVIAYQIIAAQTGTAAADPQRGEAETAREMLLDLFRATEPPDLWTVHERIELTPGPDGSTPSSTTLWIPPEATNVLVLAHEPDGARPIPWRQTQGPLAVAAWEPGTTAIIEARFTLAAPAIPRIVTPLNVTTLTLALAQDARAQPPDLPQLHMDSTDGVWAYYTATLRNVTAGTAFGDPHPPQTPPPIGPGAWLSIAGLALLALLAGAAWGKARSKPPPENMSFLDHLRELQSRLLPPVALFVLLNVFYFAFDILTTRIAGIPVPYPWPSAAASLSARVYQTIAEQFVPAGVTLVVVRPMDAVLAQLEVSLFLAFLTILPLLAYELAAFLGPALLDKERRIVRSAFPLIVALFAAGTLFAYHVMIPIMFRTLYSYAGSIGAAPLLVVSELVTFALIVTLIFGVAFELPILMGALARFGVVKPETFANKWRHAVIAIFFLSALVTPDPSVVSQALVAVPLCALYAIGVAAAKTLAPQKETT